MYKYLLNRCILVFLDDRLLLYSTSEGVRLGQKNVYERFIWFDDHVKRRKYPNATKLAAEFEVSVKTAQRDIEYMRDRLTAPLLYDQSLKGYYYEDDTFSLPMMYLSSAELSSLIIARKVLKDISGGCIGDEINTAVDKIASIIRRHTASPERVDESVSFHMIEYAPTPERIFRTVLDGCLEKRSLSIEYNTPSRSEHTCRTVDPYHMFNYMGSWHLIAYCHTRREIRDFRINRISTAEKLQDTFMIPHSFNFEDHFHSSFGLYKGKRAEEITIRFTQEKSKWIGDQIWHKDQKATVLEDGSLELSFPVADFSEIAREILKHGAGVKVIKPARLREIIRVEAEKIAGMY